MNKKVNLKNFDAMTSTAVRARAKVTRIPKVTPKVETPFYEKMKMPELPKLLKLPKISKIKFSRAKLPSFKIPELGSSRFSIKKQTFFAKRLSFLIKSGVPMLESIHVIMGQTKSKGDIKIFSKIIGDVSNGQTLSSSLAKFKSTFGNFTLNIIKAGESSGTLIDNLNYLADELKKKELLRKKILSAMLYPIIVTCATFGIAGLLVIYIFPKILPIFKSLKANLPLSTKLIIWISELLRNNGILIFLLLVMAIVVFTLIIKKVTKARFIFDGLIMRVPLFGNIVKNYNLTNTTRTLGLLLKSGSSLTQTLHITSETTENLQYKKAFEEISVGITRGKTMSSLVEKFPHIFPEMLSHMISIGEKSGNLSNTFVYLSEYYENEFEDQTKNLSSTIEPVLMIVMGIMVGFVAISVITPIYEITNNLKH
jgi:type II secretory pathway component PulF